MVVLTAAYFITQLVVSHMAHALTLLVDACHMLCNLIALSGCIITIQKSSRDSLSSDTKVTEEPLSKAEQRVSSSAGSPCQNHLESSVCNGTPSAGERRMRNTFGWARIDVLVMLICCVFLASLCFSLVVEALQLLVHIDFHDEMHHPIPVMCVAAVGILLNGVCYLMIGGYTFHQGSFLHVTESGDVVLDNKISKESLRRGQRRLSKQARRPNSRAIHTAPRQGLREMFRDVVGCLFVIMCSVVVFYTDEDVAKYVDPIMAIVSAVVLLTLSYPYMKESGLILMQTIPDHINMDDMKQKLLKEFPDILNVHEFHVWQLTSSKVISTAHIIFLSPKDYTRITNNIADFFLEQGITHLTIQPEFFKIDSGSSLTPLPSDADYKCLVACKEDFCQSQHCCASKTGDLASISIGHGHSHGHSHHGHSHAAPKPLSITPKAVSSPPQANEICENSNGHSHGHSHHGHSHAAPKPLSITPNSSPQANEKCENSNGHSHEHNSHKQMISSPISQSNGLSIETSAPKLVEKCEGHLDNHSHDGHCHSTPIALAAAVKEDDITSASADNGTSEDIQTEVATPPSVEAQTNSNKEITGNETVTKIIDQERTKKD